MNFVNTLPSVLVFCTLNLKYCAIKGKTPLTMLNWNGADTNQKTADIKCCVAQLPFTTWNELFQKNSGK